MESFMRDVAQKLLRACRDGSLFPSREEELTNDLPRRGGGDFPWAASLLALRPTARASSLAYEIRIFGRARLRDGALAAGPFAGAALPPHVVVGVAESAPI